MNVPILEPLSKNQKRNARKKRAKKSLPLVSASGSFGYKYTCLIKRKFFLYKNETFERWPRNHRLFRFTSSQLKARIFEFDVGMTFKDVEFSTLPLPLFDKILESFMKSFKTLPFKQMLDHFCPTKGSLQSPVNLGQVIKFVRSVLYRSKALELFGSAGNVRKVEVVVEGYISAGRGTSFLLGPAMTGLSLEDAPWLSEVHPPGIRQNLLAKTLSWLLSDVVNPLLTSMFHVTDSTHGRHQLFYFRKSSWQSITSSTLHSLVNQGRFRPLKPAQLEKVSSCPQAPPTASLRFIPKRNMISVRPIAKYKKKVENLSLLLALVRQYSSRVPGRADLSGHSLHLAWKKLTSSVALAATSKLYWAITDISDAFGSVKLRKLISILKNLSSGSVSSHPALQQKLLDRIKRRLALHTVEYRDGGKRRKYLVENGLLQGDPLSSDLSDLYFGDLTQTHLWIFLTPPPNQAEIFLRGTDDFLFLSTSKERVEQFLSRVQEGFPSHFCHMRKDKTLTNVLTECQITPVRFLGSLLHLNSRETSPDMSYYSTANLAMAQTWPNPGQRPMPFISSRMSFFCRQRLVPLYMDGYNSDERRLATIVQVAGLAARRLSMMLVKLVWGRKRVLKQEWAWRLVMGAGRKIARIGRRAGLKGEEVKWVAMTALMREVEREVRYPKMLRDKLRKVRMGVTQQQEKFLANLMKSVDI